MIFNQVKKAVSLSKKPLFGVGFNKVNLTKVAEAPKSGKSYDLFVIGGGSGGLAASKEAAQLGANVGLADFVIPSPVGTKWGLGGTCVNVGCIPKKLMHYSAQFGKSFEQQAISGWNINEDQMKHDWVALKDRVQENVKRTNFGYRVALRENKVEYFNSFASLLDKNRILLSNPTDPKISPIEVKADKILISVGGRPKFLPHVDKKLVITSDDLFSLTKPPKKTLIVGGSYIALECAGFLNGLGYDVTVLYRSEILREFDSDVAQKLQGFLSHHGIKFIKGEVKQLEKHGEDQRIVSYTTAGNPDDIFDTVVLAIGRDPNTHSLGLENVGLKTSKNNKIIADDFDRTSVDNIFAIGDAVEGRMELTPVAIKAGRYWAQRQWNKGVTKVDYNTIPTTVFTPLEYSSIGLTEKQAIEKYGNENVWCYVSKFKPLEWVLSERDGAQRGYCKVIVNRSDDERVIGLHYLGPHAAEVAQGFAVAIQMGAKKSDLDKTIAIHPSSAEEFVLLKQIKGVSETDEWLCCG